MPSANQQLKIQEAITKSIAILKTKVNYLQVKMLFLEKELSLEKVLGRFIKRNFGIAGSKNIRESRRDNLYLFWDWLDGIERLPVPSSSKGNPAAYYTAIFANKAGLMTKKETNQEIEVLQKQLQQIKSQWRMAKTALNHTKGKEKSELLNELEKLTQHGREIQSRIGYLESQK